MINEDFKKWATGYSGFDGGNPNGKIWICGIEWGGKSPQNIEEVRELLNQDVSNLKNITGYDHHNENMKYTYNRRVINILASIKDPDFPVDSKLVEKHIFNSNEEEKYFTKNSNYMKLNLSPFNFPTTDNNHWTDVYKSFTGFENKSKYENWVWEQREKLFQQMVIKYNPKLIITFGQDKKKGYTKKFQSFFGFSDTNLQTINYKQDKRLRLNYCYKQDKLFINLYFPSNGWLVSTKSLKETGDIIRELLEKYKITI